MTPLSTCSCTFSAEVFFLLFLYSDSKFWRITVPWGMTYALRVKERAEMMTQENIYGRSIRRKLTPAAMMDIISLPAAIFEVKKITAMKTKRGEKRFAKYGTKLS